MRVSIDRFNKQIETIKTKDDSSLNLSNVEGKNSLNEERKILTPEPPKRPPSGLQRPLSRLSSNKERGLRSATPVKTSSNRDNASSVNRNFYPI